MTELDSEADRLKKLAKSFSDAAKSTEKKMERFEGYIQNILTVNNLPKLSGEAFEFKNVLCPPKVKVDTALSPELEMEYPEFVRVKTEWSVENISKALKEGKELAFAHLIRDTKVKFSIKKKG